MSGDPKAAHRIDFSARSLRSMSRAGSAVAAPVRVLFRACGRIVEEGTEHLPAHGPVIIAAYHANYLDPILVGLALKGRGHMPHYLAKSQLFTGALGAVLRRIGQIPVLRGSARAGDSLVYARQALEAGATVVIYPQGTLTKDPELWPQPARSGAARLALQTGVTVVPVAHWGLETSYPRGAKVPKPAPRQPLTVRYGAPIDPRGFGTGPAAMTALSHRITAAIAAELAQLRGLPLPERFRADLGEPARHEPAADAARDANPTDEEAR